MDRRSFLSCASASLVAAIPASSLAASSAASPVEPPEVGPEPEVVEMWADSLYGDGECFEINQLVVSKSILTRKDKKAKGNRERNIRPVEAVFPGTMFVAIELELTTVKWKPPHMLAFPKRLPESSHWSDESYAPGAEWCSRAEALECCGTWNAQHMREGIAHGDPFPGWWYVAVELGEPIGCLSLESILHEPPFGCAKMFTYLPLRVVEPTADEIAAFGKGASHV